MSKYAIWNKKDDVYTPSGEKFTADQWIARYPIAEIPTVSIVCAGGTFNGAFFGVLSDMVNIYTKRGCDFSACDTEQSYLDAIEAFEDAMNAPVEVVDASAVALENIAAQLEFQNMMALEDMGV